MTSLCRSVSPDSGRMCKGCRLTFCGESATVADKRLGPFHLYLPMSKAEGSLDKSFSEIRTPLPEAAADESPHSGKLLSTEPSAALAGQVAVITGGASGIGAATARLFTDHGARVVIADIQPSLGEKLLKELGPQAEYVECDVRNEEDIEKAVNKAYSLENRLDIFHSNAGIVGCVGPIDELRVDEYDHTIAINLRAAVIGVKHAVRVMKIQKKGSIVITGSVAGVLGGMGPHGYTVAKSAIVGLVKSCAAELGRHNIRVNMISPDLVPTPLAAHALTSMAVGGTHPVSVDDIHNIVAATSAFPERTLKDVDIANAALYLASDMGGYVSGHNLVVDGGKTVSQVLGAGGNTWYTKYIPLIGANGERGL